MQKGRLGRLSDHAGRKVLNAVQASSAASASGSTTARRRPTSPSRTLAVLPSSSCRAASRLPASAPTRCRRLPTSPPMCPTASGWSPASAFRGLPRHAIRVPAAIARIQQEPPGFIGVSVRTRRVRPRFHTHRAGAHGRGPLPLGAGRVTPVQNARRCDTSSQAEQFRLAETLFVRPCVSHQGDAHGPKQLPHVTVDVLHGRRLYREIDGRPAVSNPDTARASASPIPPSRSCRNARAMPCRSDAIKAHKSSRPDSPTLLAPTTTATDPPVHPFPPAVSPS